MADFHQNGNIAQFHNLRTRPFKEMVYKLDLFSQSRRITLILPSLFSELEGPALKHILDELSKVSYLHRIIIGLDQATEEQFRMARSVFAQLPQDHQVLWNSSPRMEVFWKKLEQLGIGPVEPGKGKNVWTCLGYLLSCADTDVMAIHDCDITTYDQQMLARLVYPLANPAFSYQLAKGFYPRVDGEKLNGRVTRLLVSPLLIALKKVIGDRDYIDYLRSFRYPLSGEFALRAPFLPDIRIPSDWGLEIGVLSEAWRSMAPQAVCQVEIADRYDHKHQPVSPESAANGLNRMSIDICKAIFRKLAADGTVFTPNVFRTLKATYYRRALDMIETYEHDAEMNGLSLDRHAEEKSVELFAENIMRAGQVFLETPHESPFIPNWSRVNAADPDIMSELNALVKADEQEYSPLPFTASASS
jgi:glucosyl-3-phosphoglycerate synthase